MQNISLHQSATAYHLESLSHSKLSGSCLGTDNTDMSILALFHFSEQLLAKTINRTFCSPTITSTAYISLDPREWVLKLSEKERLRPPLPIISSC